MGLTFMTKSDKVKRYTVRLVEDPDNPQELILPLPDAMMDSLGWDIGDTLVWNLNKYDETITISKLSEGDD
jgi:hypothetical protein